MDSTHKRYAYIAAFLCLAAAVVAAGMLGFTSFERQKRTAEIAIGAAIYAENCAACHGANLKGEADWQTPNLDGILPAPPHDKDGHTWHHSDQLLFTYIKLGGERALAQDGVIGFNSGMPEFKSILSDVEINSVLDFIKSSWPEEIRVIQQERTKIEDALSQ